MKINKAIFAMALVITMTGCFSSYELQRIGKDIIVSSVKTAIHTEVINKVGIDVTCKSKNPKELNCKRH